MQFGTWRKLYTQHHYSFGNQNKKFYRVDHDHVISPGGHECDYFVVRIAPHAVVIAQNNGGQILMVCQHRYTTGEVTLELPMGNSDGGDLLLTARRELEEETCFTAQDLRMIGKFQEANGIAEMWGHVFISHKIEIAKNPAQDEMDKNAIVLCAYSVGVIRQMIADGRITDASTICAFAIADYQGLF